MKPVYDLAFAHTHLDSPLAAIPLTRAMQIALRDYNGETLTLAAPLAPNVNDKGCAFGGSLSSLATLAGWGVVALKLAELGLSAEIYVQDSTIRYLAPVWGAARGRGRVRVVCRVPREEGGDACTLEARFVAIRSAN